MKLVNGYQILEENGTEKPTVVGGNLGSSGSVEVLASVDFHVFRR